jgi:hypothetical protein
MVVVVLCVCAVVMDQRPADRSTAGAGRECAVALPKYVANGRMANSEKKIAGMDAAIAERVLCLVMKAPFLVLAGIND